MNQWPNGSTSAMFQPNTPGHLNPAAMYNNLGGGGNNSNNFDINQYSQGLQNGHSASPTPGYPPAQQQQQQQQSFQPNSVIPAKRPHDGMSGSPVQPQGSRSQTPNFAGFPTPQPGGQQFSNAPTPFQHLQQSNSTNATPSPTMPNQQFRPPTQPPQQQQQQQQQTPQARMQNASPSPFSQPQNFGSQMSPAPGGHHAQNPMMNMMQQGQMSGFNPQQFGGMNNMSMGGMPSSMPAQMNNNMAGAMPNNPQQAYQARLMQHQQALRARGGMPPGAMGMPQQQQHPQQQQPQQQQQQQQQQQPQNQMYNPAGQQQQMGGQMQNGQGPGGGMNLNQQKMQAQQQAQQQKKAVFLKTIAGHLQQKGLTVNLNPLIGGKPVDLYALWWVTNQYGGSMNVEKMQQWPTVAAKLGFTPVQFPQAAEELKSLHAAAISQYERLWFQSRIQQKQEHARMQATQMAGMGMGPAQPSPSRAVQPPNQQMPYGQQYQQGPQSQQQPHATPMTANAQLPQNGMSTPQQPMAHPRRESSARKPDQMTPQQQGAAPQPTAMSPHSTVKPVPGAIAPEEMPGGPVMKSDEPQSTNYTPHMQSIECDGGYDTVALFDLGNHISRYLPNMPTIEEMGVIDVKAITLSLASGIHAEVRYALDALALITNDHRIKPELTKCEELLDVIVDCAEEQIEILSDGSVEVSDGVDILSYEDVIRASRIEADTLQDVPEIGSRAYETDRAADKLIAITTIIRNLSFYEENHEQLTSDPLIKWLSNTIRLLGTRTLLLRTYLNTQDFYKDIITFLSNITQSLELPTRDDALHILHFLLAFAPQPAPAYTASGGQVRFASFGPAIHKYLPPAVDCLAKLLARQDPNRTFYKSIFTAAAPSTSSSSSGGASEHPLDLLTRAFALAISVLPDRSSKGPLTNSQQYRIVEARKAFLTQGMLAADILTSLAPHNDNELARSWLESEDGWAVGLMRLVSLLSVAPQHAPQSHGGAAGNKHQRDPLGFDTETSKLIIWRALAMLKRLAEKAAKCASSSLFSSSSTFGATAAGSNESRLNGAASLFAAAYGNGDKATSGKSTDVGNMNLDGTADDPPAATSAGANGDVTETTGPPSSKRRDVSTTAEKALTPFSTDFFRGPRWESMPQGHAIVGALVMNDTDKVALGLLCGLHDLAMLDSASSSESS